MASYGSNMDRACIDSRDNLINLVESDEAVKMGGLTNPMPLKEYVMQNINNILLPRM
jgi:hypothetical protein